MSLGEKQLNSKGNRRGMHPNSQNNLKRQWKPGESGNPKGRPPKAISLTSKVKEMLESSCPYDKSKTWLEYLADQWLNKAADNPAYFKELIERLEGKITQPFKGEIETTDVGSLSEEELDQHIRTELTRLAKGKEKQNRGKA